MKPTKTTNKPGGPNGELGQHYNFNAFRFEGLAHKIQGLIFNDSNHLGNEHWTFMVLVDGVVRAETHCPTLKEARKDADRFVKGHLINQLCEWAGRVN
jgi:hypothetical protein